jgi:hypothetical protein
MSDEKLERRGKYFCHHNIHERYGITFERFYWLVENNRWSEYVA